MYVLSGLSVFWGNQLILMNNVSSNTELFTEAGLPGASFTGM